MRSNRGSGPVLLAFALLFFPRPGATSPPDTDRILDELERSRLPLPRARPVQGFEIPIGPARLTLETGELHWTPAAGGLGAELVLFGEGRVRLDPLDAIEGEQMRLFTGAEALDTSFQRAVLTVADRSLLGSWLDGTPTVAFESLHAAEARALLNRWKRSAERERLQVDAALLRSAHGSTDDSSSVAAWLLGSDFGDLLLRVDPSREQPFWIGQLVRPDPDRVTTRRLRRLLREQQRLGRWSRLSLEDLGVLDTWSAGPVAPGSSEPERSQLGVIDHYRLDLEIEPSTRSLRGTAWLAPPRPGDLSPVVSLLLHPDLEILAIRNAQQRDLPFLRRGDQVHVVLGDGGVVSPADDLEIDYTGPILEEMPDRGLTLRDTVSWHPRWVRGRRATWDVTLRWPVGLDLVASGHIEDRGRGLRRRWERRRLEIPASGFGFELGSFTEQVRTVGGLTVDFAFDSGLVRLSGGSFDTLVETVVAALTNFTDLFGPLDIDRLQVVTVPRPTSQTQGDFITLSDPMIADWGALGTALGLDDRRQVIAHEIAHLWWGEKIPWAGESDRWLGEALADFLAATWAESSSPAGNRRLEAPPPGRRSLLWRPMPNGRPLAEAGPPVLGERLDSSLTLGLGAQEAILYGKGRKILQSLAFQLGTTELLETLGHLARTPPERSFSTNTFFEGLARSSGQELAAFEQRFVAGSGLETVLYEWGYRRGDDGRFDLWIETRSAPPPRAGFELRGDETLRRRALEPLPRDPVRLRIPLQILLGEEGSGRTRRERRLLTGVLDHDTSEGGRLEVSIDERPEQVWLDLERKTLARCFDLGALPGLDLLHRGRQLAAAGSWEDALSTLTAALDASPQDNAVRPRLGASSGPGPESLRRTILHELFRAQLESGALEAAERSLEQLQREAVPPSPATKAHIAVGRAHIALRRGQAEDAYLVLERNRPEKILRDDPEPLLVLALAARATGRETEGEEALRRARHLGAVVASWP